MHSISVVLPAPFGPMSPTISPSRTVEVDVLERGEPAEADGDAPALEERSVRTGGSGEEGGDVGGAGHQKPPTKPCVIILYLLFGLRLDTTIRSAPCIVLSEPAKVMGPVTRSL